MSSSDKTNQLFWLYYGEAIKEKAGANFGSEGVFFLATEAQKGPVAGDGIPDEYTNQGLYDIGNNLLAVDNLFYNPSALHGYAQAINTYLSWVDLQGHPDQALNQALLNALQDQDAADVKFNTEQDKAFAQFTKDSTRGLVANQNFSDYVASGSAPGYTAAQQARAQASATVQNIQSRINGPLAAQITSDRSRVARGLDLLNDFPGFNMHGAIGNILSPAELLRSYQKGTTVQQPTFQRIPTYSAPQYKQAVQAALAKAGGDYNPANSLTFQINTDKQASDFNFGQTNASANVGFSYGGWFSFNAGGGHSETDETLNTGSEASEVQVKITYDTIQLVTITPGSWNIDVSSYKLRDDAPKNVRNLARPSQLVLATQLGYEIVVGSNVASTIDSKFKETTSAGGNISIFGIPINVGASGSQSREKNSHNATWDSTKRTFKVVPTTETGFATVVGIVAEKFQTL